jgi:hypothetical protein
LFTNEGRLNPAELLRLTGEMQRDHFDFSWSGKAAAKRKEETDEAIELTLIAVIFFSLVGVILYFTIGILEQQK